VTIHLALMLPSGSSDQPKDFDRAPQTSFYSVLLQVGFAQPASHLAAGELLPHHFTLTRLAWRGMGGGGSPPLITPYLARGGRYVSVALSVGLLPLGVAQHPARRSSDFPPYALNIGRPPGLLAPSLVYS